MRPTPLISSLLLALLVAGPASASLEGPGATQFLLATRAPSTGLTLDGALEEPAWGDAPVFDAFVQLFPDEGAAPGERTELRVLHDDRNLYVGIVCYDGEPGAIGRALGRRDSPPASDTIQVLIDSAHEHRGAYAFGVNAAGVQFDGLWYADTNYTAEWDAVWGSAVRERPDGWSVELSIPLRLLRFPDAAEQTWGFAVQRHIARTREDISSVLIPRSATGKVSRFGHLTRLQGLQPRMDVELVPYLASRVVVRPQFSNPALATPRLADPSLDLGLDLRATLGSQLTLNATLNPDFGQVEADQLLLNLTNLEQFFPERRPFFTQGMDLFQPVGSEDGFSPQMLFYSRRIGLDAPILGAAKLTGTVGRALEVGVLDAVVMGPGAGVTDEARPDRTFRLHWSRPLHLGPGSELPARAPAPQNFFMGVARYRLAESTTVGGQLAAATPLTGPCTEEDAAQESALQPAACSTLGGNAAALDFAFRSQDGYWTVLGQVDGSQVVGGPPERVLRDGTVLRPGDTGLGAYVQGGKVGGEPFRFDLRYRYAAPTLDLNATGYLAAQNAQSLVANLGFTRPNGLWKFHAFDVKVNGGGTWTTDGRTVAMDRAINLSVSALLPGFHFLELGTGQYSLGDDIREISSTGIPFERVATTYALFFGETNTSLPLTASLSGMLTRNTRAERGQGAWGWTGEAGFTVRPRDWLETRLSVRHEAVPSGPRWVDTPQPGEYLFGDLHARALSVVLRQQLVLNPRLTFQLYGQLFSEQGRFGTFYTARSEGRSRIRLADLSPVAPGLDADFHSAVVNVNLVLRWEYRPGSTLFLVYARSQRERPLLEGEAPSRGLLPAGLLDGRASDSFLLKWSWWWGS
jgi:hypothetical protein